MAIVFHRGLALPLWGGALSAVALTSATNPTATAIVVVGIIATASVMAAVVRSSTAPRVLPVTTLTDAKGQDGIRTR